MTSALLLMFVPMAVDAAAVVEKNPDKRPEKSCKLLHTRTLRRLCRGIWGNRWWSTWYWRPPQNQSTNGVLVTLRVVVTCWNEKKKKEGREGGGGAILGREVRVREKEIRLNATYTSYTHHVKNTTPHTTNKHHATPAPAAHQQHDHDHDCCH